MKKTLLIFFVLFSAMVFSQEKAQFANIYFSSKCCGTASSEKLYAFLNEFKSLSNKTIYGYQICCQGKEGEFSIVIDMRNFSSEQKQKLMEGLNQLPEIYETENKNTNKGSISVSYEEDIFKIPFPAIGGKCKNLKI